MLSCLCIPTVYGDINCWQLPFHTAHCCSALLTCCPPTASVFLLGAFFGSGRGMLLAYIAARSLQLASSPLAPAPLPLVPPPPPKGAAGAAAAGVPRPLVLVAPMPWLLLLLLWLASWMRRPSSLIRALRSLCK
jgi:hypothetical protein